MVEQVSAAAACAAHMKQVAYLSIVCGESVDSARYRCFDAAPGSNAGECKLCAVHTSCQCAQRDVVLSGFKLAHHSVPSLSTLLSTNASLLASMGRFGFEPGFAGRLMSQWGTYAVELSVR